MSKIQIKSTQIKSLSLKNEQVATDAAIELSKIAGGMDLQNTVNDLQNDAFVTREVPSGAIDGVNKTFVLANLPVLGSESVFLNGLLQDPGVGNAYVMSGSSIVFHTAPLDGDEVHVSYATGDYIVAPAATTSQEIVVDRFSSALTPVSGALSIDLSRGSVFLGTLSAPVTEWSFTNFPLGNSRILGVTLVLSGPATNTYGDACRINGQLVTGGVKWSAGAAPTATNNIDIITFAIIVDDIGTVNVFGTSTTNFS